MGDNSGAAREGPTQQGEASLGYAGDAELERLNAPESPEGYEVTEDAQGRLVVTHHGKVRADLVAEKMEEWEEEEEEEDEEFDEDDEEEDDDDEAQYTTQRELQLLEQFDKESPSPVPFKPAKVSKDAFLHLGQSGATIAAGNYEGVVIDRLKFLAERTQDSFRYPPHLARQMLEGKFVAFQDEKEKAKVLAAAKFAKRHPEKAFKPLEQKTQDALLDRLVRGRYGDVNAAPHKNDVLNHIERSTLLNTSYLQSDGQKFLRKVSSLLPSQAAARPGGKAGGRPQARK